MTDNLWRALRNLRHPDNERVLWVNALCINQSHDDERSKQVSLMHAVYTQAFSVEIWLGESFDNIELALKFFEDFASDVSATGIVLSYVSAGLTNNGFDEEALEGDAEKSLRTIKAIRHIMQAPWWGRIWNVQEFALAKRSVFNC
jgi:hypothetical protein